MTRTDHWMPFFIGDYLKDTRHLSTIEHGAYCLLIFYAWTNEGVIPADDKRLARIVGMSTKEWSASSEVILDYFYKANGGYRHNRVDRELARASGHVEQRRAAGKASAAARAAQRNSNDRSTTVATEEQRNGERNARTPPTPIPEEGFGGDITTNLHAREDGAQRLISVVDRLTRLGGVKNIDPGDIARNVETTRRWIAAGYDVEELIVPTIIEVADKYVPVPGGREGIGSLAYFSEALARKSRPPKEILNGSSSSHADGRPRTGNKMVAAALAADAREDRERCD